MLQSPNAQPKKVVTSLANLYAIPINKNNRKRQPLALTTRQNMKHGILLHERGDDVGVAVTDLRKGSTIGAVMARPN